jgi:hypothetical protein
MPLPGVSVVKGTKTGTQTDDGTYTIKAVNSNVDFQLYWNEKPKLQLLLQRLIY